MPGVPVTAGVCTCKEALGTSVRRAHQSPDRQSHAPCHVPRAPAMCSTGYESLCQCSAPTPQLGLGLRDLAPAGTPHRGPAGIPRPPPKKPAQADGDSCNMQALLYTQPALPSGKIGSVASDVTVAHFSIHVC